MPDKKFYHRHRDKCLESSKEWHRNNKDKDHENYIKKRGYVRKCTLKKKYGITLEDYDRMFTEQNGLCAICKQPEKRKREEKILNLCIDHCHATGRVRMLLCTICNSRLGWFERWKNQIEDYLKNN